MSFCEPGCRLQLILYELQDNELDIELIFKTSNQRSRLFLSIIVEMTLVKDGGIVCLVF